ncbi:restriction endonuclease subunit S domain-containing protein [Streptococcus equinus]|uniref:Type I restriction enzyme, S subunit n=1 Tax=Streptococcus equinus TaxID=1335 RepID=A0A1G9IEN4_STREI|nr:restriction endonuclease subunit S [Streptococcus equinus]SDL23582.1 type I restriction enzyme, S subunit [Streptococcus equinus]
MISNPDNPCIEYEDVISEQGILNKDVCLKDAEKNGIIFTEEDILYGKLRPYLHNWLNPDFKGVAVGDWWVLRPINMDKNFLYWLIQTPQYDNAANQSSGTKMPRADWKLVSNTDFYVPISNEEQAKIAGLFEKINTLITLHQRKLFEAKNNPKNGSKNFFRKIYQKLYKFDFNFKTYDWEQRKFTSVFERLQNNTLSRAELNYENGMVKNVHYGDVLMKFGDYIDASKTELPYISDNAKVEKFKNSFLQDGDIIIADTAEDETVGKCTEIQGSEGVQLLSGLHTIACRPKEKYGPMFLGYYINSPAYHSQLKPLMQGIKVTSISKSAFQDTNMIMPKSIDEQTKIGAYFEEIDHLITLHQREVFYTIKHIFYRCCDTLLSGGL